MADVLFAVRNNYYLGAYQAAVNEAQDIDSLSDLDQVERDVFIHRSYIALGSQKVRNHAARSQWPLLQAARMVPGRGSEAGWCRPVGSQRKAGLANDLDSRAVGDQSNPGYSCASSIGREALRPVQLWSSAQGVCQQGNHACGLPTVSTTIQ